MTDQTSTETRWWEAPFQGADGIAYRSMRGRQRRDVRAALLIIDVVESFIGPEEATLEEAIARWETACGPAAHAALPHIGALLQAARGCGAPVVHCRPAAETAPFTGDTVKGELGPDWVNGRPGAVSFHPTVAPCDGELVLPKPKASAFFDTPLATTLHRMGVDAVVVAGCTTSGCVRASTVDAFSHGFGTFVAEEAVFDRSRLSAAASLWDMDARYADVVGAGDAAALLTGVGEPG